MSDYKGLWQSTAVTLIMATGVWLHGIDISCDISI